MQTCLYTILIFETFNTIVLFRPFGAWTRQRQDEKYALKYSPVFLRTKRLSKGGKGEARAVEEKKRKAAEKKIEVEKVAKDELELFVGGRQRASVRSDQTI